MGDFYFAEHKDDYFFLRCRRGPYRHGAPGSNGKFDGSNALNKAVSELN